MVTVKSKMERLTLATKSSISNSKCSTCEGDGGEDEEGKEVVEEILGGNG